MLELFIWICSAIVLHRIFCLATYLKRSDWIGQQVRFLGLIISLALVAGGVLAYVFQVPGFVHLLLFGVAGKILFDRRGFKGKF